MLCLLDGTATRCIIAFCPREKLLIYKKTEWDFISNYPFFVTVLLVCPDRPPDVYVCWAHGLLLVPCALLSIVCPLPSCYLIIVSVAPPVSPSLPSFVCLARLLVSAVLCWPIVLRRVCMLNVHSSLPLCFFFGSTWFYCIIKKSHLPAFASSSHFSSRTLTFLCHTC